MADETKMEQTPEASAENKPLTEEEIVEKIDLGASLRKEHKDKKPVNSKLLIILAAVVVALAACAAIFIPKIVQNTASTETVDNTIYLSTHTADQVTSITVDGENKFTITRDEDSAFHVDVLSDDKLNTSTCSSAFTNAAQVPVDQIVEDDAQDMSLYGLDQPICTTTFQYNDGEELVLEFGDTLFSGQIYARQKGTTTVYAMKEYFAKIFAGSLLRYRGLSLPETSTELDDIKSIIIRQKGQEQIRFMPEAEGTAYSTTWSMTEPKKLSLDTGSLTDLIEGISSCKLYGYEGKFTDLKQFGLDDPWFTVIMSDVNGVRRTISLGDYDEETSHYYCTIDDSGEVFTMSDTYTSFASDFKVTTYLDVFANIVAISAVDDLSVTDGTTTYTMAITRQKQYDEDGNLMTLSNGDTDYLETYLLDGVEQQETPFKKAYQAVIGVTISNLAQTDLVDETAKPVLTVTYNLNTQDTPLVVEYLPYDLNNYAIRRDGVVDMICKKELVDSILPTLSDLKAGLMNETEDN